MKEKRILYIENSLKRLEDDTFQENDIRLLLIEVRDLLKNESFLREICHFIAHPDRNQGIFHRRINTRHAKMKFSSEKREELMQAKEFEKNPDKPYRYFSDQILGYIDTKKIESKIYEMVILDGIDEIPENLFEEYYKMKSEDVKYILSKAYIKHNGYYILNPFTPKDLYSFIDDVLKFIRGTITGKGVFSQQDLEKELIQVFSRIVNKHSLSVNLETVKNNLEGIIVCIISILHEAKFKLFDKTVGKSFLSVGYKDRVNQDYTLQLSLHAQTESFYFPVLSTEIEATKYIDAEFDEIEKYELHEIPWKFAIRDSNNKIKLKENVV